MIALWFVRVEKWINFGTAIIATVIRRHSSIPTAHSILLDPMNFKIEIPYRTPSLYQYWASLNPSRISFFNTGQVLKQVWQVLAKTWVSNTCKLIPKSKPAFQKISSENFEFHEIFQRATIFALIFGHFPGVL